MLLNVTAWTLIHFLWQGAIITIVFALADVFSRRASARLRYGIAALAMLMMLTCAGTTFFHLANASGPVGTAPLIILTTPTDPTAPVLALTAAPQSIPRNYLPWLVYFWIAGVTALSLRLIARWVLLERCRRQGIRILESDWQEKARRIARRLQLRQAVRLYESAIADVPAVIGWIRPIILLPVSALTQLSPAQIEALLAHELAHVRRHDYLINLLQSCVETLFFYHPGVWWIGRRMREERENCCDDLAVMACGDPLMYARALADLEQLRSNLPALAMAANGGHLLNRIQRLIVPLETTPPVTPVGITTLVVLAATAFMWAAPQEHHTPPPEPKAAGTPVMIAQAAAPKPQPQRSKPGPPPPAPRKTGEDYIDQMDRAGYRNLSVDQLIAMKIHGVTPDYINEIKSLGWNANPDQLVSMRIHGVNAETVKELRALGYSLTTDQAIAARIHQVDAAFANGWKQEGLTGLNFDTLVSLKIHGANPAEVRELKSLGFKNLDADDIVRLRVMGVTPDFILEARKRGFRDLTLDQIVQLKQLGILSSKESK